MLVPFDRAAGSPVCFVLCSPRGSLRSNPAKEATAASNTSTAACITCLLPLLAHHCRLVADGRAVLACVPTGHDSSACSSSNNSGLRTRM
jgi:hypothetical protein